MQVYLNFSAAELYNCKIHTHVYYTLTSNHLTRKQI